MITKYHRQFLQKATGLSDYATDSEAAEHLAGLHPDLRKACQNYAEAVRDEEGAGDDDGDDDERDAERHLPGNRDVIRRRFECPTCRSKYTERRLASEPVETQMQCSCGGTGLWQLEQAAVRAKPIVTDAGNVWSPQRPDLQNEINGEPSTTGIAGAPDLLHHSRPEEAPESAHADASFECPECGCQFRDDPAADFVLPDERRCPSCGELVDNQARRAEHFQAGETNDEEYTESVELAARRLAKFEHGAIRNRW